jgi:hypothetical protein
MLSRGSSGSASDSTTGPKHGGLEWAGSLALAAGAQLEVRGVIDDRAPGGLVRKPGALNGDAAVAKRTSSLLQRALAASRATGAAVRVDVTRGDPNKRSKSASRWTTPRVRLSPGPSR